MLTIKSPIQLRCRIPIGTVHQDFSERISANYTILNSRLRKEELLYITTQAPEVYFAEGSSVSILNDIDVSNNQEIKLDMINNLINRILVAHTDNFSYQDSVYISSMLRKLGITDVANFMKQVYELREETRENNRLINIYNEQKKVLNTIHNEAAKPDNTPVVNMELNNEYHDGYYLHEEIYNRLDTGNIYQEIHNFSQGLESNTRRIYSTEIALSEQISMAQNFNLHQLKKEVLNFGKPISYYHTNMYEMAEEEDMPKLTPEEGIGSAILLNLVDGIYSMRVKQIENNTHNWYSMASSLFQSADNTWKRYETYHNEGRKFYTSIYDNRTENNISSQTVNNYKNITQKDFIQNQETLKLEFFEELNNEAEQLQAVETVTEITKEQLDEINRRNIENYKRIQEIEQSRPKRNNVEIDKERAKKDALRALDNPQQVLMEFLNTEVENTYEDINMNIDSQIYNLFTDETKAIFNQYMKIKRGEIPMPPNTELPKRELTPEEVKLHHFMKQAEADNNPVQSATVHRTERIRNVDLVHKVEEQLITEELIDTIRSQTIDNRREEIVEHNQVKVNTNERQIQETINNVKITKQDNIEEIVQQNVKKQLNQISDQVYGKIEKKLQTERKRRGF